MHHVKHLRKDGNKPSGFLALMSKLNRKQIPLCTQCHQGVHAGLYNGLSLKELKRPERVTYIIKPEE
jgi:predicted HNH restriction endonuclease